MGRSNHRYRFNGQHRICHRNTEGTPRTKPDWLTKWTAVLGAASFVVVATTATALQREMEAQWLVDAAATAGTGGMVLAT